MNRYKYIFGPVKSRRLGISLGIDIMPHKICSFDCIYCECGKTTSLTEKRLDYILVKDILKEIDSFLSQKPNLDYITFSGSGEPTLHKNIKTIINYIKNSYPQYKVALLTNSSLFSKEESLISDIQRVDLIAASLDAATQKNFELINRPKKGMKIENIIDSLCKLRKEFKNSIWLEMFFINGFNNSPKELLSLKEASQLICPDKITINSLDRPGTEAYVKPLEDYELKEIEDFFGKEAIISDKSKRSIDVKETSKKNILETIRRRPSRVIDIAEAFGMTLKETEERLYLFEKKGMIKKTKLERGYFYSLIQE